MINQLETPPSDGFCACFSLKQICYIQKKEFFSTNTLNQCHSLKLDFNISQLLLLLTSARIQISLLQGLFFFLINSKCTALEHVKANTRTGIVLLAFQHPVLYKSSCNELKDTVQDKLISFFLLSSESAVKIIGIYLHTCFQHLKLFTSNC